MWTGLRKWKTPNLPEVGDYYLLSVLNHADGHKEIYKRQIVGISFKFLTPYEVYCLTCDGDCLQRSYKDFIKDYSFYRKPKDRRTKILNTGEEVCIKETTALLSTFHVPNVTHEITVRYTLQVIATVSAVVIFSQFIRALYLLVSK